MPVRKLAAAVALTTLAVVVTPIVPSLERSAASATLPPNVIVILTDDQVIDTLQKMPHVLDLVDRGTSFDRAFVSNPLCCPSRATILTGLSSGHTGVWTNGQGGKTVGGWPAFSSQGRNEDGSLFGGDGNNEGRTVALHLQQAGYATGLFGKYLNKFARPDGSAPPTPVGWSSWHSFVGGNGGYYDYITDDDGVLHTHGDGADDYSTDVLGRHARRFLRSPHIQDGTLPFFLYFAPFAPHGNMIPAPADMGVRAPGPFESPAFNERNVSDKPPYVREQPRITTAAHDKMRAQWDRVYGTLRSVDRWLGRFERQLPVPVRARTIFIFTSDNGFEWGDHRLNYKEYPYERSIRVPMVIAGPGILAGSSHALVENADLTPTILDLAGLGGIGGPFDGASLVPVLTGTGPPPHAQILLEHLTSDYAPSYCGLRTARWAYVRYRDGFEELYDLAQDPDQMHNVATVRPRRRDLLAARTIAACDPAPPDW
jgi:N-acetylglucosamine-6-sulfatase